MPLIALDAMGGDRGPSEMVAGAVEAAGDGVEVVLVGDERLLSEELARRGASMDIVHAPEAIGMGDDPVRSIREKPESSVAVAARLVRSGGASGFVSAGSTGAALAAAAAIVGRVPGVSRPTIASIWPTPPTPSILVDSGANPVVKPEHLLQFALMGTVAAEVFLGMESPRVGLLSNGEERGKGRELERAAHLLLDESDLNFVGNVEARDVGSDRADVFVTDGFTGNVFLKAVEGTAAMIAELTAEAVSRLPLEARVDVTPILGELKSRLDPETYGGGHLLGVAGVVVISHGSSTARSVANALRLARDGAARGLVQRLSDRVAGG